jgi:hypothetical protein
LNPGPAPGFRIHTPLPQFEYVWMLRCELRSRPRSASSFGPGASPRPLRRLTTSQSWLTACLGTTSRPRPVCGWTYTPTHAPSLKIRIRPSGCAGPVGAPLAHSSCRTARPPCITIQDSVCTVLLELGGEVVRIGQELRHLAVEPRPTGKSRIYPDPQEREHFKTGAPKQGPTSVEPPTH